VTALITVCVCVALCGAIGVAFVWNWRRVDRQRERFREWHLKHEHKCVTVTRVKNPYSERYIWDWEKAARFEYDPFDTDSQLTAIRKAEQVRDDLRDLDRLVREANA
jgi:hypothetical protein